MFVHSCVLAVSLHNNWAQNLNNDLDIVFLPRLKHKHYIYKITFKKMQIKCYIND